MAEIDRLTAELREKFGRLERIDPAGELYQKLCGFLDQTDERVLEALYAAKIKFVSLLAWNRLLQRGKIIDA